MLPEYHNRLGDQPVAPAVVAVNGQRFSPPSAVSAALDGRHGELDTLDVSVIYSLPVAGQLE